MFTKYINDIYPQLSPEGQAYYHQLGSDEERYAYLSKCKTEGGLRLVRKPYRKRDKSIEPTAASAIVSRQQLSIADAFKVLIRAIENEAHTLSGTVIEAYSEQIDNLKAGMAAAKKRSHQKEYELKRQQLERLQAELDELENNMK